MTGTSSPRKADNAKAKDICYDLTDGGRLVLEVMPSGSKTWRLRNHLTGKRQKVTIGTSLAMGLIGNVNRLLGDD